MSILDMKIRRDIIDEFGVTSALTDYLDKIVQLEILKGDQIINPDPSKEIFIKILEIDIKELEEESGDQGNDLPMISRYLNYHLPSDISVHEFFTYVKEVNKDVQKEKST